MKAVATKTSRYVRRTDNIFGKVESFELVHEHRIQIEVDNSYFVSTRTYADEAAAHRAAKRLEAKP